MESIITLYKIGHGPSSSHTMGPANAAKYFKNVYHNADKYKVTLYGSLALTGKGHLTDQAILETLSPIKTEIIWNVRETSIKHPNTMDFEASLNGKVLGSNRFYSIGGGAIQIEGDTTTNTVNSLYKEKNGEEIINLCKTNKWELIDYVKYYESKEFWKHLNEVWNVMQSAIKSGLDGSGVLPGKLKLMRKAQILFQASADTLKKRHIDKKNVLLMAYAFAVSETNASGGVVVTAPTCGACGVLPAILKFSQDTLKVSENKIIEALAVAGLIGNIARTNATIAGAEGGCQAEVGVACAMAAAAYSHLIGSSNSQIFQAASVALEHHLGLTCDPVLGYVQSPCIERNAFAAIRALDAANYTSLMQIKVLFNYDDILETMLETGRALNAGYRETSTAGLASIYNKKKLSKTFKKKFDIKIT